MLSHAGAPLVPHDAWTAWTLDPLTISILTVAVVLYARGSRPGDPTRRRRAFTAAIIVLIVALISPIDALAETLLTFHMVQHVLLVSVAAALLAVADPWPAMRRGLPVGLRRGISDARRGSGLRASQLRQLRHPVVRYLAFVVITWMWHAARLYDLAVENRWTHALEHAMFLAVAVGVWSLMIGAARQRTDLGAALALSFGLVLQGVGLSALMVFARQPWYSVYANPPAAWGMTALDDQHLAGLIMWFIGGLVFIIAGIALAIRWIETSTPDDTPSSTSPTSPTSRVSDTDREVATAER